MGFEQTSEAEIARGFWISFSEAALELAQAFKGRDELRVQEKLEKFRGMAETMPDLGIVPKLYDGG